MDVTILRATLFSVAAVLTNAKARAVKGCTGRALQR